MTTSGWGGTSAAHMLCGLFSKHPELVNDENDIHIHRGRVEIAVVGERGTLKSWCRAIPQHSMRTALVPTMYGAAEADVIEADHLRITVRRPLVGPGGVA